MNKILLPKVYTPTDYEEDVYYKWEASGFFNPDNLPGKRTKAFSICLPPPNATGVLHLGHASMLAYQDLMVRFHRLLGDKTLWLPGTDHAAIATQSVVEKKLIKEEGKTKEDIGREEFLLKVNAFVVNSQETIRKQVRAMGASLDWSREKFTLDEDLSKAVRTVFKMMYDDGLIYRGNRIVNWCPKCQSTISDDEVEHEETKTQLYYIKYGPVTIATTRPETKLGDTGLAVNPKDKRYKDLIGQELSIDLAGHNIKVKVFADEEVDMDFGTGAIGVTPGHSQQDYLWAEKYGLEIINVIDQKGLMTENAGSYKNLPVSECRQKFVNDLAETKLIEKIEDYDNNLAVCYRCGTAIEPLTSKQWFVDVNKEFTLKEDSQIKGIKNGQPVTLKKLMLAAVKNGQIKILPDRFEKVYFNWVENLHDWCISRQLWYGHRIPVWYDDQDRPIVSVDQLTDKKLRQDPDTLDTWFSSGLWTFSTLGWPASVKTTAGRPDKTDDLKTFHPTAVMETGYDLIFFWVARMILMSTYVLGEIPFETVYFHGLVRTKTGEKMSKSKPETCIDPLAMIKKYGTDALRLAMIIGSSPGNDIRLYEEKIAGYRNFVNKLWNISRYILSSIKEVKRYAICDIRNATLADRWILAELHAIISSTTKNIEEFNFSRAGEDLYEFTWNKLADWYLEIAKIEGDKDEILLYLLEKLLILWHPFCPFATETLWDEYKTQELLMVQPWPQTEPITQKSDNADFEIIREIITAIRNARSENKIDPKKIHICSIKADKQELIDKNRLVIEGLAKIKITPKGVGLAIHSGQAEIILDISQNKDLKKSRQKEVVNLKRYVEIQEQKLANREFVSKAPASVIDKEKEKLAAARSSLAKLTE